MKKLFPLLLLASVALGDTPLKNEGVSVGNVLSLDCVGPAINCTRALSTGTLTVTSPAYTTADVTLYVDPTGSDSNACTSTGASACLTIQGALNKVPKILRHRATVAVAAGNYSGFVVAGFTQDNSTQSTTGGLLIQGTLANSTGLASGTASGTASAGTASSGSTWATLTDASQGWTTNDLRGRFLARLSGTGASANFFPISSNTATTITVTGAMSGADATSTYAIKDATSIIATGVSSLPMATTNGSGTNTAIAIEGTLFPGNVILSAGLTVSQFKITAGQVQMLGSGSNASFYNIQNTSSSSTHWLASGSGVNLNATRSYSAFTTHAHDGKSHFAVTNGARVTVVDSMLEQGEYGLFQTWGGDATFTRTETHDTLRGISASYGVSLFVNTCRVGCDGSSGEWGVLSGESHDGATGGGMAYIATTDFSNCSIMIQQGGGYVNVNGISGAALRHIIKNLGGGKSAFSGVTATSAVSDINLGSNGITEIGFSSINASGGCVMSLADGASACRY